MTAAYLSYITMDVNLSNIQFPNLFKASNETLMMEEIANQQSIISLSEYITTSKTNTSFYKNETQIRFFEHYFAKERLVADSILASVSFILNAVAFMTSRQHQHQHYAYYALFKNLTFANALFCLSLWLSNNTLLLFVPRLTLDNICTMMSMMVIALVSNSIFGLVSTTTLMGFSLVHYVAVCHPQIYPAKVNKLTVNTGIATIWVIFVTLAVVPVFILIIRVVISCGEDKLQFVEILSRAYMNTTVVLHQLVLIFIVGFCIRIHLEIRTLQSTLSSYRWMDEMELERKTFKSILFLLVTLILFYLPFNIVFIISYNQDTCEMINSKAVIFYMTLLPYFKFCTDPILYRKSFIDFQSNCQDIFGVNQGCSCCQLNKKRRSSLTTRFSTYKQSSRKENKGRGATIL